MMSPWRFTIPSRFESDTHQLLDEKTRIFTEATKAHDEALMRKIANDLDDIDELLDSVRALVTGMHPDILGLKPSKLQVPAPFTVRFLTRGGTSAYFRIQDPPPQGWPFCIVPKKTSAASLQQRFQEVFP